MARGYANGLANKVFRLQALTGGGVPGEVVRAARLVKEGNATTADLNTLRSYLGIEMSGATQAKTLLQQVRQAGSQVSHYAVLAHTAAEGGIGGAAAGFRITQLAARDLEKLVQTPQFQAVLTKAVGTKLGSIIAGSDPNDSSQLSTIKAGYALRRGIRLAGATVGYAAFGAAATYAGLKLGDILTGQAGGEDLRNARSDLRIAMADHNATPMDRRLAEIAVANEQRKAGIGKFTSPLGMAINEEAMQLRIERAAQATSADTGTLYQLSRERFYQNRYGFMVGSVVNGLEQRIHSLTGWRLADTEGIADIAEKSAAKADRLRQEAYDAAGRRDFTLSRAKLDEAKKEVGEGARERVWENPEQWWKQQVSGRGAVRVWPALNMTRAKLRTGD